MNDNKNVIVKNTNEQNQSQTQKSWMDKVLSFIEMIKYTIDGKYNISLKLKVFGILGLIYLISPIDIIPEALLGPIGLADDAAVLALLWKLISSEILNFENSKNQKFQENTDYEIIDK
jgi:uncharacterized membrane protein YkvA (DUF1232 family)